MAIRALPTTTITIANNTSISTTAALVGYAAGDHHPRTTLVGIVMPSSWTAASLTFQASNDNSTFTNLYAADGSEVTVQAAASRWIALDPADFAGIVYLQVRSGTSGAAVNQSGADRVLTLVLRPVA